MNRIGVFLYGVLSYAGAQVWLHLRGEPCMRAAQPVATNVARTEVA